MAWQAAMAAWSWYGPGAPPERRSASVTSAAPSSTRARFQRLRSWSASRTRSPASSTRVARRASVRSMQRQQAGHLGLVGQELAEQAGEPHALVAEVDAHEVVAARRGVALGEHEVGHAEHGGEAVGELVVGRHPVGDVGVGDLAPGPDQPLGHRRLGHEQRPGDLGRGQAADRAQAERHAGLERQRRVAAGEDQAELVVAHARVSGSGHGLTARRGPSSRPPCRRASLRGAAGRGRSCGPRRSARHAGRRGRPTAGHRSKAATAASCTASSARSRLPRVRVREARTRPPSTRIVSASRICSGRRRLLRGRSAASSVSRHPSPGPGGPRPSRARHRGSGPPRRGPRRGRRTRAGRSRRAPPWSRRRGRRW